MVGPFPCISAKSFSWYETFHSLERDILVNTWRFYHGRGVLPLSGFKPDRRAHLRLRSRGRLHRLRERRAANEFHPVLSTDGQRIWPLPPVSEVLSRGRGLWRVDDGGESPFSPIVAKSFFRHGDALLSVEMTTAPKMAVSAPTVLFEIPFFGGIGVNASAYYDVSSDGEHYLVVSDRPTTESPSGFTLFDDVH